MPTWYMVSSISTPGIMANRGKWSSKYPSSALNCLTASMLLPGWSCVILSISRARIMKDPETSASVGPQKTRHPEASIVSRRRSLRKCCDSDVRRLIPARPVCLPTPTPLVYSLPPPFSCREEIRMKRRELLLSTTAALWGAAAFPLRWAAAAEPRRQRVLYFTRNVGYLMLDHLRKLPGGRILPLAALLLIGLGLSAAEPPKRDDINARFRNPDVDQSIKNFEGESREIFQKRDEILAACGLRPGLDVADVGAGTGLFTRLFAAQVSPGKVYAVDIAQKFIDHIEKSSREQDLTNVIGVVCADDSTGLEADSVDLVFICDTYHHFGKPEKNLASIRQALRPGGRLVIVEFEKIQGVTPDWVMNHVRPDKQMVIQEVTAAGFQLIDQPQESMSGQYILQFQEAMEPKSQAASGQIFPYRAVQATLPNGLKTIVIPLDSPGLVTYWSIVRTGSRDEVEPGRSGFAHFFEHMMFRGTKKYPGPVYDEIVTSLGADSNAYTTDDYTAYHMTFAKEDLERVMEIESDRFQNLSLREAGISDRGRRGVRRIPQGHHAPVRLAGGEAAGPGLRRAHLQAHHDRLRGGHQGHARSVRVQPVVLPPLLPAGERGAADRGRRGSAGGDRAGPQVLRRLGAGLPAAADRCRAAARRRSGPAAFSTPARRCPSCRSPTRATPSTRTTRTTSPPCCWSDLAFGETSEIYQKLVLDQQTVQAIEAYVPLNRDVPLFDVIAMVKDAADLDAVRDEIYQTLERFQAGPADPEKLAQLKRRHKYAFLMDLDTPDGVAEALARPIALTGGIECVDRMYAALDRATPEDVMRAARKYFVPARRHRHGLEGNRRMNTAMAAVWMAATMTLAAGQVPESNVVLLPVASDPTISFRLWFRVGSQNDPPGKEGLAALTAAMLTEASTEQNPYDRILELLYPMAAGYSSSVTAEMTVISGASTGTTWRTTTRCSSRRRCRRPSSRRISTA